MSSPNKSCSEDYLERVIDMRHYDPLIHQQFSQLKIQVVMLPPKGHETNPTELLVEVYEGFYAVVEVVELTSQ